MIDLTTLLSAAADLFDVSDSALRDGRGGRGVRITQARWAVAYVLYEYHQYTVVEIGAMLHRDHTTICYALKQARQRLLDDPGFAAKLRALEAACDGERAPPAPPAPRMPGAKRRGAWAVEESIHIAMFWWGVQEVASA